MKTDNKFDSEKEIESDNEIDSDHESVNPIADQLRREFLRKCRSAESTDFISRVLAETKQPLPGKLVDAWDQESSSPARRRTRRVAVLALVVSVACACLVSASINFDWSPEGNSAVANNWKTAFSDVASDENLSEDPNAAPVLKDDFHQGVELISSGIGGTLASFDFARNAASRLFQHGNLSSVIAGHRSPKKFESNIFQDDSLPFRKHQLVSKFAAKVLGIQSF